MTIHHVFHYKFCIDPDWKSSDLNDPLLCFFLLFFDSVYPLLPLPQLHGIQLLAQSNPLMFPLTPNDCFQISICDNLLTSFQVIFFEVWRTMTLSQDCDIDVILSNLWLQHSINLKIAPNFLRCHIVLTWNSPAAQCTMPTFYVINQMFFPAYF